MGVQCNRSRHSDGTDALVRTPRAGRFLLRCRVHGYRPVTSARTETGKYIFGFLIGAMAIIIRVLNPGYPEGMMLAILLMNIFAPLIDYCVVQGNISRREKRAIKSNN